MIKTKICPIMAKGWLANKWASYGDAEKTFSKDNLPKCLGRDCGCWDYMKCGLITKGR